MGAVDDIVERCTGAERTGTLDLVDLPEDRHSHPELLAGALQAWWVASAGRIQRIRVSEGLSQPPLHRAGLLVACAQAHVDVEVVAMADPEDEMRLSLEGALVPVAPPDLVTLADVHRAEHRPPEPDDLGRRYAFIHSLIGPARQLGPSAGRRAANDAGSMLYELIDNVHRWAEATYAQASIGVTRGGGGESFDRVHLVVFDNGRGIVDSVLQDPRVSIDTEEFRGSPVTLLEHLLSTAFADRGLPNHNGHGLHVTQMLAASWVGRVDLLSSDPSEDGLVHHAEMNRRSGVSARKSFHLPGLRGTLVSITFNLVARAVDRDRYIQQELAELAVPVG